MKGLIKSIDTQKQLVAEFWRKQCVEDECVILNMKGSYLVVIFQTGAHRQSLIPLTGKPTKRKIVPFIDLVIVFHDSVVAIAMSGVRE